ncbi:Unknown protein [Striga hermonthica]|uniref:Uncharacterized protein n=1 Tax=Striga hermonthica TaxID=68872 RepID=A0A9N7NPI9_STRHE|nr:Unknown protein [Striga hermonthica]
MGNCLLGGAGDGDGRPVVRVATSNGGVMEFRGPVTVESITDEFPGHGIFLDQGLFWKPLPHAELLLAGESYRLLPLADAATRSRAAGHVRSTSAPPWGSGAASYRMSFDGRWPEAGRVPIPAASAAGGGRFWKVKLVISPEQLVEILAEDGRAEELIESVRTVAKCGSGGGGGWGGFSDQWSIVSSKNATLSAKDVSLSEF